LSRLWAHFRVVLATLCGAAVLSGTAAFASELEFDCETYDCSKVLPGAVRFDRNEGQKYWQGVSDGGDVVGWVVLSTEIVDIKGYSGKPIVTLVGLDPDGSLSGVEVVEHSEPILLLGIPEESLKKFTDSFVGLPATTKVSVGGSSNDPAALNIDAISGATVTVLAEERTIMETARQLGMAVGVVERAALVPGHFAEVDTVLTWEQLEMAGILGHLTVSQLEAGKDAYGHDESDDPDEPFIDLRYTVADAPHVGQSLLGKREYKWAMGQLEEGEHLFVLFGQGVSSFKGSGFVRGGIFDRIRVEQGLNTVMFTDRDYHRLNRPRAEGAPRFKESAWFRTPAFQLDPGRPFQLVFLASRFSGNGAFDRTFSSFVDEYQLPKSVYVLDGPDPNQAIWRGAWRVRPWKTGITIAFLLAVVAAFVGRRWTTGDLKRLKRIHIGTQVAAFLILGVWLHVQPSVTQILTFFGSLVHGWRWGLFLSDPVLWVSWIFIGVVTLVWGRGVFCGWVCPYGAMNEVTFLVAQKLGLPAYEFPDSVHQKLRYLRYGVFLTILAAFLYSAPFGEKLAEVEPFKSTFFVPFWSRGVGFVVWWVLLAAVAAVMYRPFCRYICPLGAALAALSVVRRSGPYRRDFCTHCKICTRGCEPRAIRPNGTIDAKECLSCMECEANYGDDQVCPPLVKIRRANEAALEGAMALKDPAIDGVSAGESR